MVRETRHALFEIRPVINKSVKIKIMDKPDEDVADSHDEPHKL